MSSRRSIIFSPAWDFIRSSLKPMIKASHINLHQLAAHLPWHKSSLLLSQRYRPQGHKAKALWRRQQRITPCQTSCQHKLCQQDGEITWQGLILNLIFPLPQNAKRHLLLLNRFSIQTVPLARQESWHYLRDTTELGGVSCVCRLLYVSKQT